MEGVEEEAFSRIWMYLPEVYGEVLDRLEDQGLLKEENGRIFLPAMELTSAITAWQNFF